MTSIVGYPRVSAREQDPQAQEAELVAAGAVRVFVDHGESSRVRERPQWLACLDYLREGTTLLVRRLDRVAGSEKVAIETINELHERGINIKSLTEPDIDTTTPMGRALFGIVAVFPSCGWTPSGRTRCGVGARASPGACRRAAECDDSRAGTGG